MLGKELIVVRDNIIKGNNQLNVDLSRVVHSGIYLYQIHFETTSGMKSISSGKIIKN
jgi:hypothetical protein